MTQVEMHDVGVTPAPAGKPGVTYVTDARGRKIGWKRLGYLDNMRLADLAGPNTSKVDGWMLPAMVAYSVVEIDGTPEPKATTRRELEAMVQRLGDEAMDALIASIAPQPVLDNDAGDEVERAKN